MKRNRGFTLGESMIVLLLLCLLFWFIVLFPCVKANCFVTERGALRAVQVINPGAVKLVDLNRGIYHYSQATVEGANHERSVYNLDANILFNVKALLPEIILTEPTKKNRG